MTFSPPKTVALLLCIAFAGTAFSEVVESWPMEPAVAQEGVKRFEQMSPEDTGIEFENRFDHPRRWQELWRQYFNGSIGTGVTLGDVNGDRRPDVFLVGKDSPNALYLNHGDFLFEDVTQTAGVAGGSGFGAGASFVDFDNDGDLDLYVCYVGGKNELFINDGKGVFSERAEAWGLDLNEGSNAPSFADYDRDGDLDLYLQQNFLHGSGRFDGLPDYLFEQRDGRFVDVTEEAGIEGEGQGHVAIWWDYNEDGWPDIYVANDFGPADKLYRNNGDGTFTDVVNEVFESMPYSAMGADFGDLNNDGHNEFLVSEMAARDREYYQQAVGPLSGKLVGAKRSGVNQFMQNVLSTGVGPRRYLDVARFAGLHATEWTWSARFADLNCDGRQDAFFANGMARAFHDGDLGLKMNKARTLAARVRVYEISPPLRERNLAYLNRGDFQFEEIGKEWGLDKLGVSFAAAMADLDGDGDLDLVLSNWKETATVYRNNSVEGNRIAFELVGRKSNAMGVGAKVEVETEAGVQVRELSLMRGYMSADEPALYFGLGEAESVLSARVVWPSGISEELGALEANRRYRIVELEAADESDEEGMVETLFVRSGIEIDEASASEEAVYQNYLGQFLLPFVEDRLGPALALADFDGDGWIDVALGGASGQALRVFRNEQGKRLVYRANRSFERDEFCEDASLTVADFDGDGLVDLFVTSGGVELDAGDPDYEDRLYLNRGDFWFERADLEFPAESTQVGALSSAGGSLLLATGGGTISRSYPWTEGNRLWRWSGDGFESIEGEEAKRFGDSGRTRGLLWADLDGDGVEDLVQAREFGTPQIWKGSADGGLAEPEEFGNLREGLWGSLAVADFDGDGRQDLFVGNLGLNNKYATASEAEPAVLLASQSEAYRGKYIEAVSEGGVLYPRESRIFHQVDFPDIADKTGSYEAYSRMTIEGVFGEAVLREYERYEILDTESAILFQGENGRFRRGELPRLSQMGRAISSLAADVEGDGDMDLLLVLETIPPQPVAAAKREQSFLVVLLNDGSGGFKAELPWESGLELETGEARGLAWGDLDGDGKAELVVSANEGPLAVFSVNRK